MDAAARIRALVADTPGLHLCLAAILDRRDRTGQLPDRLTVGASPACAAALVALFSARAVRPAGPGKVRLDLATADARVRGQHGVPLDFLLYRALGRDPADPRAEEQALRARLAAALTALPAATTVARAYLDDARAALADGRGAILADARARGADAALTRAADVVRGIEAALANPAPVRRATFAARVFGDSKALQPGRELPRAIGLALVELDPATRDEVFARLGDRSDDVAARLALESRGIFRDEAALTVHCFGPLIYVKGGERFDHVSRHARQGDVAALTLRQLRGAALDAPIARATVIENQTTFLDYIELGPARGELVVLGRGQASHAVVALLELVAAPICIACDLDRSGVLIWRSLARRLRTRLEPIGMDRATYERVVDRGRALAPAERTRLARLLAVDPPAAAGHDLLLAISERARWVEQEAYAADILFRLLRHQPSP